MKTSFFFKFSSCVLVTILINIIFIFVFGSRLVVSAYSSLFWVPLTQIVAVFVIPYFWEIDEKREHERFK